MVRVRETAFSRFFSSSISGSVLLIVATILAMIFANSGFVNFYQLFLLQNIEFYIGGVDILATPEGKMNVARFVNDALMAIFFFSVGLEIKREVLVGELSNIKHAMLPIIGALGGILIPIAIFYFFSKGTPAVSGCAIPMATDIAFSLGVLSLLGNRVPLGLKVFLTALAVADDLGGIIVIAIFYSSHIAYVYLLISLLIMLILYFAGKRGVDNTYFYLFMGIIMWFLFYHAGIHPTIAGVIVAFFVPARTKISSYAFLSKIRRNLNRFPVDNIRDKGVVVLSHKQTDILNRIHYASNTVISPLQKIEEIIYPFVNFAIIPIFAFVNAGVILEGITVETLVGDTSLSVFMGLFFGKFIGIFTFSFLAIKSKIALIPKGVNMRQIAAVSIFGGIGFTVSLFIADLSYSGISGNVSNLLNEAKMGILLASLLSSIVGFYVLKSQLPKESIE
ncbi:MAG: Na+/H+ antiporter NhaA [Bacteroidetes bacterium]|nr:Na+/H+ antiporter NhaA [Bacteroidota bacterium]